ncbi:MAG: TadE family protein [Acidobacteriota bacterium]
MSRLLLTSRGRCSARKGSAMIELALSAGVMLAFLGGTFQFGYTFYAYNQLVTAVGNGARYAAMRTYRSATPEDIEKGREAIRNMVVYGDSKPDPGAVPVVANLKPQQVQVEWTPGEHGAPNAVTVSISHFAIDAVFTQFDFGGRPSVEFPYVGNYAPAESER